MRAAGVILLSGLIAAPVAAQSAAQLSQGTKRYVSVEGPVVALEHVRVVDGTGKAPVDDQTVVIANGRIQSVGPAASAAIPAGATRLDLKGHTVLPGYVGLHDHTFYTTSQRGIQGNFTSPLLYLASGVTTIRTTGSFSPYHEINLKRTIEAGRLPGPRMHITGPYLTGETGNGQMHQVMTPADARRVVAYWASEGATWLKFYTSVSRDVLRAAVDEAHKHGVKVTGHLCSVSFREAVAAGIDNLEHGLFVNTDYDPDKKPDACPDGSRAKLGDLDLESDAVKATFREMLARKVPMTSTLAVYELYVPNRPPLEQRMLEAMSPEVRAEYLASRARLAEPGASAISPEIFRKAQDYEVAFVRAGGLLGAGVDPTGNGGALPGFGDQRNYELLIESGFTPVEAIQIMSLNGAKILGVDKDLGSVTAGKLADLIVIDGDPVTTPADIRKVVTVFKDGVGYDSERMIDAVRGLVGVR
ncbi:MAG TPA: amidohydrolase family protein [Gemmatimonadales bacterium]|nr:amidohydrolase family protein [Gemmatimonadales bacterium]